MYSLYEPQAPKKATNLSVNSDSLKNARDLDINLSAALEQALAEMVKTRQKEVWLKENHEAIETYNNSVVKYGVFSDGLRNF